MKNSGATLFLLAIAFHVTEFSNGIPAGPGAPGSLWAHGEGIYSTLPDNLTKCHNLAQDDQYKTTKAPMTVFLQVGSMEAVPGRGTLEQLKASIHFNETWFDSKFASCMADGTYGPMVETYLDWMESMLVQFHSPRTQFEPGRFLTGKEIVTKINQKGYLKFQFEGNFEFGCVTLATHYPFDTAHCHITVASDPTHDYFDYKFGDVEYEDEITGSNEYRLNKVVTSSEMTDLWKSTVGQKTQKTPRLLVDFQFVRTNRYEVPLFLGPAFLVILSWAAFFVSADMRKGAYWTLAILLSLVIYLSLVYQTFPPARSSRTVLGFFSGCIGLLFMQIWYLLLAESMLSSKHAMTVIRNVKQKLRLGGGTTDASGATVEPYAVFTNGDKEKEAANAALALAEHQFVRSKFPRHFGLLYNVVVYLLFIGFWYASA